MRTGTATVLCALLAGCGSTPAAPGPVRVTEPAVHVLLVGDVMLGAGVASVGDVDRDSVFEGVRHLIIGADLAAAGLGSPLSAPSDGANAAELLARTGVDVMVQDDTITALDEAGLEHIDTTGTSLLTIDASGLRIGFLAFDIAGDPSLDMIAAVRDDVDVLIVSLYGGTENPRTDDPGTAAIAAQLADAGVDVVWGDVGDEGDVVQPTAVYTGERSTVVTSLGSFLSGETGTDNTGYLLEILVDGSGVLAYRVGITRDHKRRVEFVGWTDPVGDAAWLDDSWWSLTRIPTVAPATGTSLDEFRYGDLIAAAIGDIDGDDNENVVASFRRPHETTTFMEAHPEVQWEDAQGRDAHLGVYEPGDLDEVWVAGTVLMPIAELEVCDGSLAVMHDQLDDPTLVAGGAWTWNGFGFSTAPIIPGDGTPACADIDGDGDTEPLIVNRG